ncbi:MAG: trypsin-like peptidase domain-containing protein [Oscillospiraceae bacterium]|nr:trypsin-like peptidase domain-containing protein [Oscillospiraceae bacterium]
MEEREYRETENETKQVRRRIFAAVAAFGLVCGCSGFVLAESVFAEPEEESVAAVSLQESPEPIQKAMTPQSVFYENVQSVVAVNNESTTNVFGQTAAAASSGSGFILSDDGYILTNYHVIENAQLLTVVLYDGTQHEAQVIGADAENDLALLKIEASGLHPVRIGNSADLQVGEVVCAIGNPLGELTNTLTAGYISALDREINTDGAPINMMQTDCAINAGNSGGPLFDMRGDVIAIITAKYYGDTIEGLGFAIPIDDAAAVIADLKAHGYVTGRARLGITALDMDSRTAELYSLPRGVFVYAVEEGSGAANSGLRERDIITAIGETRVQTMTELISALRMHRAGERVTVHLIRDGAEETVSVVLDEKTPPAEETEVKLRG